MKDHFLYLDIETTGLDPHGGYILEVAFAKVDRDFKVVDSISRLVDGSECRKFIDAGHLSPFILDMHGSEKSGLLDDLKQGEYGYRAPYIVEHEITQVLLDWGVDGNTPICGSSVQFDRNWLNYHMTDLNDLFHYRNIDSSSDMEYLRVKYPALRDAIYNDATAVNRGAHRALSDIEDSVDLSRRIDKYVFEPADFWCDK